MAARAVSVGNGALARHEEQGRGTRPGLVDGRMGPARRLTPSGAAWCITMVDPQALIVKWRQYRQNLEANLPVLLVELNRQAREQLEDVLQRCQLLVTTAVSAESALGLLEQSKFPMALVSSILIEMDGLTLVKQMRKRQPRLEVMLTTRDFSLELIQQAFDLSIRDIIRKPILSFESVERQIRDAARYCVDHQMRYYLLGQLRNLISSLDNHTRQQATLLLEQRLDAYKRWLGNCNHLLVVEDDHELRTLSDTLFQAEFQLQTVTTIEHGIQRLHKGDINVLFLRSELDPTGIVRLLDSLHRVAPSLDVVFIAPPQLQSALTALSHGAALYLPRVPELPDQLILRLERVLARHRERRLLDNLLLELFRELLRVFGHPADHGTLEQFSQLTGQNPSRLAESAQELQDPEVDESVAFLDEVLSDILEEESAALQGTSTDGSERRRAPRLHDPGLVRYRPGSEPARTLAMLGDLSEGGLFIRTPRPLSPGTLTELDLSLMHEGEDIQLSCKGRVVWAAQDDTQRPHGPGFGVKFLLPSEDVAQLLRQLIGSRLGQSS